MGRSEDTMQKNGRKSGINFLKNCTRFVLWSESYIFWNTIFQRNAYCAYFMKMCISAGSRPGRHGLKVYHISNLPYFSFHLKTSRKKVEFNIFILNLTTLSRHTEKAVQLDRGRMGLCVCWQSRAGLHCGGIHNKTL